MGDEVRICRVLAVSPNGEATESNASIVATRTPGEGECGAPNGAVRSLQKPLLSAHCRSSFVKGIRSGPAKRAFHAGQGGLGRRACSPTLLLGEPADTTAGHLVGDGGRLALLLITGIMPGVIASSVIRGRLAPGPHVFAVVVAAVLPGRMGVQRAGWAVPGFPSRQTGPDTGGRRTRRVGEPFGPMARVVPT